MAPRFRPAGLTRPARTGHDRDVISRAHLLRAGAAVTGVATAVALGLIGWQWNESRLPASYNVMDVGHMDAGGGPAIAAGHGMPGEGAVSVADLRGPSGTPDTRFTLTAAETTLDLGDGRTFAGLAFNGRAPGPELRVRQGDLVEVTLVNRDVGHGVSIHWHGVDVPNAEDGVAGVTQDAVLPGETHRYRFRADRAGTFWYHTHQAASSEVRRGLFGALVIEPSQPAVVDGLDLALVGHDFGGTATLDGRQGITRRVVAPGTPVRLRLINSDNGIQRFALRGAPFRVLAIDGTDLNEPGQLSESILELTAGGRYDVGFTMPAGPVALELLDTPATLVLSADGRGAGPPATEEPKVFDPTTYGRPAPTPFDAASRFDRRFTFAIGRKPGFFDGRPGQQWTINGGIYPDVPVFMVERGDLVELTIVNDTSSPHPMHLHGHHVLVLSHDGRPVSGSPWWADTIGVEPGGRYVVAFRADNPGIWMDHCHNLRHAAKGLTMHVAYAGVTTPYTTGGHAHNRPE